MRRLILLHAVAGVAIASWHYEPPALRAAHMHYWYSQCANFTAAQEAAVFEQLPPDATRPVVAAPYLDANEPEVWSNYQVNPTPPPRPIAGRPILVQRVPRCLARLVRIEPDIPLSLDGGVSIAFCHERTRPGGHRRLVCVSCVHGNEKDFPYAQEFTATAIEETSWGALAFSGPSRLWDSLYKSLPDRNPLPPMPRILAGQADASDTSHFTTTYEWNNGTRGTIDGWLEDDDMIFLSNRGHPADLTADRELYKSGLWPTRD